MTTHSPDCAVAINARHACSCGTKLSICCDKTPTVKGFDQDGICEEWLIECGECHDYALGRSKEEAVKKWNDGKRLELPK